MTSAPRPPKQSSQLTTPNTDSAQSADRLATTHDGAKGSKSEARKQPKRAGVASDTAKATSDAVTLSLIRRVFASSQNATLDLRSSPRPIEDILPPLTSSNEVDVQLYAILAVVVKEFVNSWYAKLTTDRNFVEEVVQIFAHCTRALEQRLRRIDVVEVLLDDVPKLVSQHYEVYRMATSAEQTWPDAAHRAQVYHSLNPHPALNPFSTDSDSDLDLVTEQKQNETIYCQLLIQGTLAVLLPTEDLQNAPLRVLVGDIVADMILGRAVAGKICEGWFLHAAITNGIMAVHQILLPAASKPKVPQTTKGRLEQFGLLSDERESPTNCSSNSRQSLVGTWVWRILQAVYLAFLSVRYLFEGLSQARYFPKRHTSSLVPGGAITISKTPKLHDRGSINQTPTPVLGFGIFSAFSTILRVPARMPWLEGMFSFWQYVLLFGIRRIGATNSILDRFLHRMLEEHVLSPSLLPLILLQLRASLFPNNSMGPPAAPAPDKEERMKLKRKAAESILSLIPAVVANQYYIGRTSTSTGSSGSSSSDGGETRVTPPVETLGETDEKAAVDPETKTVETGTDTGGRTSAEAVQVKTSGVSRDEPRQEQASDEEQDRKEWILEQIEQDMLDPLSDTYMNKHLVYGLVELILVRLIPELSEQTVTELFAERGVAWGDGPMDMNQQEEMNTTA